MAQYKCIMAPKELEISNNGSYDQAVRDFAVLINGEAKDGWKFYSMESIALTKKPGCLGMLLGMFLGSREVTVHANMLVFVKE